MKNLITTVSPIALGIFVFLIILISTVLSMLLERMGERYSQLYSIALAIGLIVMACVLLVQYNNVLVASLSLVLSIVFLISAIISQNEIEYQIKHQKETHKIEEAKRLLEEKEGFIRKEIKENELQQKRLQELIDKVEKRL